MQVLLQLATEVGQPLKRQQVGTVAFRMAAVTQAFQLALLAGAQSLGASAEVGLLHRPSNQAPADRRPREAPGMRVR